MTRHLTVFLLTGFSVVLAATGVAQASAFGWLPPQMCGEPVFLGLGLIGDDRPLGGACIL